MLKEQTRGAGADPTSLPLLVEGRSKRVYRLDAERCLVELLPTLSSFSSQRHEVVQGTAELRLDFFELAAERLEPEGAVGGRGRARGAGKGVSRVARVVVVSGANRGTGRGIAEALQAAGDLVMGLNRTPCGESWLHEVRCDLRSREAIAAAVDEVARRFGRIDVLVNNAAVRRFAPLDQLSPDDWEESLAVNLSAPFYLTRAAAPHLIASKGLLVFMGSHAGMHFFEAGAAYCCTKAALHALAEVAVRDLRYRGVRVATIAPGAIANRPLPDDGWKLKPRDIGELVVKLASLPPSVMPAFVEVRPGKPLKLPVAGIDLLQHL
ncbi:MAG: SDR family NAD(P)-dependent oxidoreductase [Acetobacteraceae bacterium]|nr:SDR family NAD(P)-dependent oxidoreductase [Acetobacteraceae bacterium]